MEAQLEKIREVQKEAWNKSSSGWKKWDDLMMNFLKPLNTEMIRMLNLNDTDIVLDVATGTGEPGLTIASLLKSGKVVGIDLQKKCSWLLMKKLIVVVSKILRLFAAMFLHSLLVTILSMQSAAGW